MKSLKIRHRIATVFLVMLGANIVSLALLNAEKSAPIDTIEKERHGALYLQPLRQIRQWLPVYKRLAESDPRLLDPAANPASRLNLDKAVAQLDELDRRYEHELNTTEDFVELKKDWIGLQAAVSNPAAFRGAYGKLNDRIRAMIALVGDSAGLMLDSALNSYYLINVCVVDLPTSEGRLNALLDIGTQVVAKPQAGAEDNNQLLVMAAALRKDLDDVKSDLDVAANADPSLAALDAPRRDYEGKLLGLLAYVDSNMINRTSASVKAADHEAAVRAALDANFKLFDAASPHLDRILAARSAGLRADKTRVVGLILLMLAAGAILTAWMARSAVVPMNQAIAAPEARGSVDTRAPANASDDRFQELTRENEGLKSLVVELSLANQDLKGKSAAK